jgi:GrpB-like predicted nucleotidyltransferase (UPF0157 family)
MRTLRLAADLGAQPMETVERERRRLQPLIAGELELTGGSSVPGALTGGDIDLHLIVHADDFVDAVDALGSLYDPVHEEIWSATLATFAVRGNEDVGLAVTPIGSEHERRFRSAWAILRSDPTALADYNAMKLAHAAADEATYRRAKARFFDALDRDS